MPKITFYSQGLHPPHKISGEVPSGMSILDASEKLGILMRHDCGGFATCSTCRVFVHEGMRNLSAIDLDEENMLEEAKLPPPYRLSCQTKILGEATCPAEVVVVIDDDMDWSKGAFGFLSEIPESVRRIARIMVEKKARKSGLTAILPDFAFPTLEEVKKKLEEVSGSPALLAAFTKELYESQ
ncbi:MAG: 2Fe-2S iron-sulfur cluster binding domain-containing protein [Nitrospirae bacterium]|nr:2Fe-2S iron-sulfur cluster binding domain-containing protein [Candidatus Troglogloeales bacterium]